MESTGIYWLPLYQILEKRGFEVKLVNARHVKNVPGRKTDVKDSEWLQQLHSYGLLRGSFRPTDQICVLRSYSRQRENLVRGASAHILRMQKALTQMNLRLNNVISDITGTTGTAIIKAIIAGEHDPIKLAQLRSDRIKNDITTIAKALEGDYREEHLFVLRQELESYEYYQGKIKECDEQISKCYAALETKVLTDQNNNNSNSTSGSTSNTSHRNKVRKSVTSGLKHELYKATGVDFTKVPGFDTLSIQKIIAEVGIDMSKWPTEKHFTSWLGLSPANKITGEKVFSTRTNKVVNKASTAFRLVAFSAGKSKTSLGGFFRKIRSIKGAPKAITATARKMACLFYRLLKYGQAYVEKGMEYYEQNYKKISNEEFTTKS